MHILCLLMDRKMICMDVCVSVLKWVGSFLHLYLFTYNLWSSKRCQFLKAGKEGWSIFWSWAFEFVFIQLCLLNYGFVLFWNIPHVLNLQCGKNQDVVKRNILFKSVFTFESLKIIPNNYAAYNPQLLHRFFQISVLFEFYFPLYSRNITVLWGGWDWVVN